MSRLAVTFKKVKTKKLVWHYTTGDYFELIFESRTLCTTDAGIAPGERPAVWFSKDQFWEPTAQKATATIPAEADRATANALLHSGNLEPIVLLGMRGTYERGGVV